MVILNAVVQVRRGTTRQRLHEARDLFRQEPAWPCRAGNALWNRTRCRVTSLLRCRNALLGVHPM